MCLRLAVASVASAEIDEEMQTPGLPIRDATKIAMTIGPDGVAKLRAEAGRVDPDRLGDRKLW